MSDEKRYWDVKQNKSETAKADTLMTKKKKHNTAL